MNLGTILSIYISWNGRLEKAMFSDFTYVCIRRLLNERLARELFSISELVLPVKKQKYDNSALMQVYIIGSKITF